MNVPGFEIVLVLELYWCPPPKCISRGGPVEATTKNMPGFYICRLVDNGGKYWAIEVLSKKMLYRKDQWGRGWGVFFS